MEKRRQIFLREMDSGEPAMHCGDTLAMAKFAVACGLEQIIVELLAGNDPGPVEFRLEVENMSAEEILALPEGAIMSDYISTIKCLEEERNH